MLYIAFGTRLAYPLSIHLGCRLVTSFVLMFTVDSTPTTSRLATRIADWMTSIVMRAFKKAWYAHWSRPLPTASSHNNILTEILQHPPAVYGYEQAVWSLTLLHQHLAHALGLDVSLDVLANRLQALNIRLC